MVPEQSPVLAASISNKPAAARWERAAARAALAAPCRCELGPATARPTAKKIESKWTDRAPQFEEVRSRFLCENGAAIRRSLGRCIAGDLVLRPAPVSVPV